MLCLVGEKEKSPEEEEESVQPRVPCTIEGHSAVASEIEKLILASKTDRDAAGGFIEPVRRGRNRAPRHRYIPYISSARGVPVGNKSEPGL